MERKITVTYDDVETIVKINNNSLTVPEGVKFVNCSYNQITELKLPEGVKAVWCDNNVIERR